MDAHVKFVLEKPSGLQYHPGVFCDASPIRSQDCSRTEETPTFFCLIPFDQCSDLTSVKTPEA